MKNLIEFRILISTLIISLLITTQRADAQVQTAHYNTSIIANSKGFYDYLPQGYNPSGSETYPLMIFIHGVGELGDGSTTNLPKVLRNGPPKLASQGQFPVSFTVNGQTFKFIIVSPQFVKWPTAADINGVIDYCLQHYKVNINRIYLTGLSMGGGVVWTTAGDATAGKRLAAIAPFCGAAGANQTMANTIADNKIGVWGLHNLYDTRVSPSNTINFIKYILTRNPSAPVKKSIFGASGHDCWTPHYLPTYRESGKNVYEWLLQFQKGSATPVLPVNQAPTASAGANQSLASTATYANLSGTASDNDNGVTLYSWTKVSGPSTPTFTNAAAAATRVDGLVAGTYVFKFTATDPAQVATSSQVTISVGGSSSSTGTVNKAPVANAGADKAITLPTNSVSLSGSGTDADGSISKYAWTKIAGPSSFTISSPSAATTSVTGLVAGTYTFRLAVTDNAGAVGYDSVNVRVSSSSSTSSTGVVAVGKALHVNVYGIRSTDIQSGWNNWYLQSTAVSNVKSGAFKYDDGTSSSISAVLSHSANTNDNYAGYGSGMAPAEVLRYDSYDVAARTLTISGLSTSKTYNLEFYASRKITTGESTIFKIGTTSQTIVTDNNLTNKAVFSNLQPNAQGQIVVTLSSGKQYNFLNGFAITENASTSTTSTSVNTSATTLSIASSAMTVSPNPFTDKFMLQVNNSETGALKVQLINASGVVSKEFNLQKSQTGSYQVYLSAGELPAGNYTIKAQINTWSQSIPVVKS